MANNELLKALGNIAAKHYRSLAADLVGQARNRMFQGAEAEEVVTILEDGAGFLNHSKELAGEFAAFIERLDQRGLTLPPTDFVIESLNERFGVQTKSPPPIEDLRPGPPAATLEPASFLAPPIAPSAIKDISVGQLSLIEPTYRFNDTNDGFANPSLADINREVHADSLADAEAKGPDEFRKTKATTYMRVYPRIKEFADQLQDLDISNPQRLPQRWQEALSIINSNPRLQGQRPALLARLARRDASALKEVFEVQVASATSEQGVAKTDRADPSFSARVSSLEAASAPPKPIEIQDISLQDPQFASRELHEIAACISGLKEEKRRTFGLGFDKNMLQQIQNMAKRYGQGDLLSPEEALVLAGKIKSCFNNPDDALMANPRSDARNILDVLSKVPGNRRDEFVLLFPYRPQQKSHALAIKKETAADTHVGQVTNQDSSVRNAQTGIEESVPGWMRQITNADIRGLGVFLLDSIKTSGDLQKYGIAFAPEEILQLQNVVVKAEDRLKNSGRNIFPDENLGAKIENFWTNSQAVIQANFSAPSCMFMLGILSRCISTSARTLLIEDLNARLLAMGIGKNPSSNSQSTSMPAAKKSVSQERPENSYDGLYYLPDDLKQRTGADPSDFFGSYRREDTSQVISYYFTKGDYNEVVHIRPSDGPDIALEDLWTNQLYLGINLAMSRGGVFKYSQPEDAFVKAYRYRFKKDSWSDYTPEERNRAREYLIQGKVIICEALRASHGLPLECLPKHLAQLRTALAFFYPGSSIDELEAIIHRTPKSEQQAPPSSTNHLSANGCAGGKLEVEVGTSRNGAAETANPRKSYADILTDVPPVSATLDQVRILICGILELADRHPKEFRRSGIKISSDQKRSLEMLRSKTSGIGETSPIADQLAINTLFESMENGFSAVLSEELELGSVQEVFLQLNDENTRRLALKHISKVFR